MNNNKMKVIMYSWGSNSDDILKKTLIEMEYKVFIYNAKCEHYTKDLKFAQSLINLIHENDAEAVISNDYFPIISIVCKTTGILYYSWVYDSPHYTLFAVTSKYQCNRIGCFDRSLVKRLNRMGIDTVKHIPLGVDWTDVSDNEGTDFEIHCKDKSEEIRKYTSDVSFVGSLYTDVYNYYDELVDDDIKVKADEYIKRQCFEYKRDYLCDFFENDNTGTRIKDILVYENLLPGDEYIEDIEYIFAAHFLEKKVTVDERYILLNALIEQKLDFALYTGSDLKGMPNLKRANRGIVDYYKEMPIVFKNSKINVNITLRSIKTGIPLRALDIMGCGGFLLSNYQEELAENFKEDREVVLFYSLDDCLEKIDYYLSHDEERSRIARAGQEVVNERFAYKNQLVKLLNEM